MGYFRNFLLVFCCCFCVAAAKRIKCSDIVTRDGGDNRAPMKFTLKIPISNRTDIVVTRVRLSGPQETISRISLNHENVPEVENEVEIHYVLTLDVSMLPPLIADIDVSTVDQCISYCEGRQDYRPNIMYRYVSSKLSLFGKPDASSPNCIDYEPIFSPLPENCGITLVGKIFGGTEITRGAWPWLVPMYIRNRRGMSFRCGGNIISRRTILTAAHCLINDDGSAYNAQDIRLFTGRHDLRDFNEKGFVFHVAEELVIHPEYTKTHLHDIALINLADEIEFTNFAQPVCLWSDTAPATGNIAAVAGWGKTEDGIVSRVPLFVEPTIVDINECKNSNEGYRGLDLNFTICAGDLDQTGPCKGDSGGGLILVDKKRKYSIRGLVSMNLGNVGTGTCDLSNFVLYTDVAKYYNWIRSKMW